MIGGLELVLPTGELKEKVIDFKKGFTDRDERMHGVGGLSNFESYEEWLKAVENNREIKDDSQLIPSTQYFSVLGDKIIGAVNIRHRLNEALLNIGGNIGYSIRPTERRKGYATKMLALALLKCRNMGLEKVLITCYKKQRRHFRK